MTRDEKNRKVAELLERHREEWGWRLYCKTPEGRALSTVRCYDCEWVIKKPLPFCTDPAAAWRLLVWVMRNDDPDALPYKVNIFRSYAQRNDLDYCVSINNSYMCAPTLTEALVDAVLESEGA